MATPERRPQFSPEVAARRAQRAARAERMKAVCKEALGSDGPDTTMRARDPIFDGAADLATAKAQAAVERGRPLKLHERRALRHEELARQAGQTPGQPPRAQPPRLRDRLEAMSDADRDEAVASVTLGTRERAYIEHLVDSIREDEGAAEYLNAVVDEEQSLRNIAALDDDEPPFDWDNPEADPVADAAPSWSPGMTPAEMRAAEAEAAAAHPWDAAQAALAAGPLYTGDPAELEDEDDYFVEEEV
jgi:hypothetical protein